MLSMASQETTRSKQFTRRLLAWAGQVVLAGTMAMAFFVWAPWSAAISIPDAEKLYGRTFPADWKAVEVNHGHFTNEPWGTTDQHPVGYILLSTLVFGPAIAIFAIGFRSGYRGEK